MIRLRLTNGRTHKSMFLLVVAVVGSGLGSVIFCGVIAKEVVQRSHWPA